MNMDKQPMVKAALAIRDFREDVAAVLGMSPDAIPADADLFGIGLGDRELGRLVDQWRDNALLVDPDVLAASPTLGAWGAYLRTVSPQPGLYLWGLR
ncbi:phosphopantetheine-binding protein [Streptomyces sp. NPDC002537]